MRASSILSGIVFSVSLCLIKHWHNYQAAIWITLWVILVVVALREDTRA